MIQENNRVHKITYDQMMKLRRETWAVAFKQVEGQWYCNVMLLGGLTERIVKRILGFCIVLLTLTSHAQTITIPIRVADTIEFQLQQKYHLDTLVGIQEVHINQLIGTIDSRDSLAKEKDRKFKLLSKVSANQDSIVMMKDNEIKVEKRKRKRNGFERNLAIIAVLILGWIIVKPQ